MFELIKVDKACKIRSINEDVQSLPTSTEKVRDFMSTYVGTMFIFFDHVTGTLPVI